MYNLCVSLEYYEKYAEVQNQHLFAIAALVFHDPSTRAAHCRHGVLVQKKSQAQVQEEVYLPTEIPRHFEPLEGAQAYDNNAVRLLADVH